MGKICEKCGKEFPLKIKIDGKVRNLCNRKFCLECSPFGCHNTRKDLSKKSKLALSKSYGDVFEDVCEKHGTTKFVVRKNGHAACRACVVDAVVECRKKKKRKLVELCGGKCIICGYNKCPQALQFHHMNPSEKSFNISHKGHCRKWEEVVAEVKKCILVCANCHAEIENGIVILNDK